MKKLMSVIAILTAVFIFAPAASAVFASAKSDKEVKEVKYVQHNTLDLLKTSVMLDLTILGPPMATKEQCLNYLYKRTPLPLLTVSPRELVDIFYAEGLAEGVRPDVAFAQSLHETGNFRYGGDVVPLQNNYCGLGTVGGGVKGAWFVSAKIGVRAQIQHLLAYATTRPPRLEIVDPRYDLVKKGANFGRCPTWVSLNGKWAVPGKTYGQKILAIHRKILLEE